MFFVKLFKNILQQFGFFQKHGKIIFLGLDNAGKTTLLKRLKDDKHDPTMFATSEELRIGNIRIKAFDIGGHPAARKAWKNYFPNIDGIVYLVDAADKKRLQESYYELQQVLSNPMLSNIPIAILGQNYYQFMNQQGNKIDKQLAVSEDQFNQEMGLNYIDEKEEIILGKTIKSFMCSISKKQGLLQIIQLVNRYMEAFEWLGSFLK